jgi:hypothetical protein
MKRKSNLSEELYKMRKLMNFDSEKFREEKTSLDTLVEEKMVEKLLIEQTKVSSDVYGKVVGSYNRTELPGIVGKYNPNSGFLVIKDGNPWLAEQRAISLSKFLATNVEKQTGVKFNSNAVKILETSVSESKGDEYQYVEGVLYAILESPEIPEEKYAFDLLYNFYEIGDTPHIVVTKMGMGSPVKVNNDKKDSFIPNLEQNGSDAIKSGGFVVFQQASGREGNIGILIPVPKTYAKRIGSRLYFGDEKSFTAMREFIQKYTDGKDSYTKNPKSNYLSSNWTSTQGGGGNYLFGKEGGANAIISSGPNKGKETVIKRTYFKETGKGGAPIPGTGKKGEWVKIGEFNLTKAEGAFADNMIQIQSGSYQKVFDELKKSIEEYMVKTPELRITEISASVKGFASADSATNRTNIGKPDHDWGVGFPADKWITK